MLCKTQTTVMIIILYIWSKLFPKTKKVNNVYIHEESKTKFHSKTLEGPQN